MNLHQFLTSICFVLIHLTLVVRFGLDPLGAFLISVLSVVYFEVQRALKALKKEIGLPGRADSVWLSY